MQALCKQPEIMPAALDRLKHSESAEVRLLAAQTVRKQCRVFWSQLSPQVSVNQYPTSGNPIVWLNAAPYKHSSVSPIFDIGVTGLGCLAMSLRITVVF